MILSLARTALIILACAQVLFAQDESSVVYSGNDNRLTYVAPLDKNGIRGALLLKPGIYNIDGVLFVRESEVVLRGSGHQANPETSVWLTRFPCNQRQERRYRALSRFFHLFDNERRLDQLVAEFR